MHDALIPSYAERINLVKLLIEIELYPKALEVLETMERELVRLQQLIDDLFALSQAEVGKLALRLEPTDVGSVVRQLVDVNAPLAWRQRRVEGDAG